jgi:FkbM family methyltransferase
LGTSVGSNMTRAKKGRLRKLPKLIRLLMVTRYRGGIKLGVAAAVEHEAIPFESSFRTVIDVGAHTGQFALFARHAFSEARIVCIEPLAGARMRLEQVLLRLGNTEVLAVAVSATDGVAPFHVSRASDSSSLRMIRDAYTTAFPRTELDKVVQTETRTLDTLFAGRTDLEPPILLKIDVQGAEMEVLAGGTAVLSRVAHVLVETSFVEFYDGQALADDVIAHLRGAGFRLQGVHGLVVDECGRCLQADLLFNRA